MIRTHILLSSGNSLNGERTAGVCVTNTHYAFIDLTADPFNSPIGLHMTCSAAALMPLFDVVWFLAGNSAGARKIVLGAKLYLYRIDIGWLRSTVGATPVFGQRTDPVLRLACSRRVTTIWVNRPLQVNSAFHPSGVDK